MRIVNQSRWSYAVATLVAMGCGDSASSSNGGSGGGDGGSAGAQPAGGAAQTGGNGATGGEAGASPQRDGSSCSAEEQCLSGFCVEGVCCDTACTADCDSCLSALTGAEEGSCAATLAGAVCRAANGDCDVQEVCDGQNADCPNDLAMPKGAVCRPDGGDCDDEEVCDGLSKDCPEDYVCDAETECRFAVDACDAIEICDGISPVCPADELAAMGTTCRPANGPCDTVESCDGQSLVCPADAKEPTTTVCRPEAAPCDVAESCNGLDACPADQIADAGAAPMACAPYTCSGASMDCPTSCSANGDCTPGLLCVESMCVAAKRVFVTSQAYQGNLGGVAGGDGECQARAQLANLPGTYKAWLSASAVTPVTSFNQFQGPYVRVDGVKLANNFNDLVDTTLAVPISVTETGADLGIFGQPAVWTGTTTLGNSQGQNCSNWFSSSSGFTGHHGLANFSSSPWTSQGARSCNLFSRLYCFEQ